MGRPKPIGHELTLVINGGGVPRRGHAPQSGYTASCDCGWSAGPHRTAKDGKREYASHLSESADGVCNECGENFDPDPAIPRGRFCFACRSTLRLGTKKSARDRERSESPDAVKLYARHANIKSKYGLSPEDVDLIHSFQNGECAICHKALPALGKKGLHVDHCHRTGRVRGLLCGQCNKALGMFGDNALTLSRAAFYLLIKQDINAPPIPARGRLRDAAALSPPPDTQQLINYLTWMVGWIQAGQRATFREGGRP